MIRKMKKFLSLLAALAVTVTAVLSAPTQVQAVSGATGVGLAEHCMTAYYERWSYVYGGTSYGAVDCSGLIVTYKGVGGCRTDLLGASPESGLVSNGVPRIHGLGLKQPGHVGVYVGNGMFVDARSESQGICYQSMSSKNWVYWFKVAGVSYPTTGWQTFMGNRYYYQNGQYVINCTLNIDGEIYTFGSDGIAHSGGDASSATTVAPSNKNSYSTSSSTTTSYSQSSAASAAAEKKAAEEAAKKAAEEAKKAKEKAEKTATSLGKSYALTVLSDTAEDTAQEQKELEQEANAQAALVARQEEEDQLVAQMAAVEEDGNITEEVSAESDLESQDELPAAQTAPGAGEEGASPAQDGATTAFLLVLLTAAAGAGVLYGISLRKKEQRAHYVPAKDMVRRILK
ncbi:MAG: hypothetical protein ACI4LH_00605, partial [Candidatus Heritagella sp.]